MSNPVDLVALYGPDAHDWAPNTRLARADDWRAWSQLHLVELSGETAISAIVEWMRRGVKWSTIERRLSSLRSAHLHATGRWLFDRHESSEVRQLRRKAHRDGLGHRDCAPPLLSEDLAEVVLHAIPRDRALILVGWHGALRASEIAALTWSDVTVERRGIGLELRDTKTGLNQNVYLPRLPRHRAHVCAVAALTAMEPERQGSRTPLFGFWSRPLSRQAVSAIVARCCYAAGLGHGYSGHSLRSGYATSCALAGIPDSIIAQQTRHRSLSTLALYIRPATLRRAPPALTVFP